MLSGPKQAHSQNKGRGHETIHDGRVRCLFYCAAFGAGDCLLGDAIPEKLDKRTILSFSLDPRAVGRISKCSLCTNASG